MTEHTYQQSTKVLARSQALSHAVELLTTRRDNATVAPKGYVRQVREGLVGHAHYEDAAKACDDKDADAWDAFRKSSIGVREASDLAVAYLAGPEPANDLQVLVSLGVQPENIWGFETEKGAFTSALAQLQDVGIRGFKLMKVDLESYFMATPRRFDIIYFDACAPLPSHSQKTTRTLATLFRYSALAPLGVLITNFARPDITKENILHRHAWLMSVYLYPKAFLDTFHDEEHTISDGAGQEGWDPFDVPPEEDGSDEFPGEGPTFVERIKADFDNYYGSFITRHIIDIASIIVPTARLLDGPLWKTLFAPPSEVFVHAEEMEEEGDAGADPDIHSLLWSFSAAGLLPGKPRDYMPTEVQAFLVQWAGQLCGQPQNKPSASDAVRAFYACRDKGELWAGGLKSLVDFNYWRKMPFFCDVPTDEIAFYSSFAQLAYPAHCNVPEVRRFTYTAEGKQTPMYLDVLPFDECRYIYDWLSSPHLFEMDWSGLSAQITFRFALDAVAKVTRWYQNDFLYGCHAAPTNYDGFDAPELPLRKILKAVP